MLPRHLAVVSTTATATLLALAFAGSATPRGQAVVTVHVTIADAACALSRTTAPVRSTVRFAVRNRAKAARRFSVSGRRTKLLRRGGAHTITLRFARLGRYGYRCTQAKRVPRALRGTFRVVPAPQPKPPPEPPTLDARTLVTLTQIATVERPVLVTAPAGDDRLFVVQQGGAVSVLRNGVFLPRPFLDLDDRVTAEGEAGLLSIAFAPDYAASGLVYAFYNVTDTHEIRISEFRRDARDPNVLDPSSERTLLAIEKPAIDHNGGMLQFGPDGYLYAAVGDGDAGVNVPPGTFAQRLDVLLGSILRIDPRGGDPYAIPADNPFVGVDSVRPEIWAYGLRNPWRFWIDPEMRAMLIADVGARAREEVNLVKLRKRGVNFGWPCFEGTVAFDESAECEHAVAPLFDVERANGVCAIIGGVVSRDERIPVLAGRYLYGDLCTGRITSVGIERRRVADSLDLDGRVPSLSSFGVDGAGRVYATSTRGGVFRLDPAPSTRAPLESRRGGE